jgi:hypothetical protein
MVILFSSQTKNNDIDGIVYVIWKPMSSSSITPPPLVKARWDGKVMGSRMECVCNISIKNYVIWLLIIKQKEAGETISWKYDVQNTQNHEQATNLGKPK